MLLRLDVVQSYILFIYFVASLFCLNLPICNQLWIVPPSKQISESDLRIRSEELGRASASLWILIEKASQKIHLTNCRTCRTFCTCCTCCTCCTIIQKFFTIFQNVKLLGDRFASKEVSLFGVNAMNAMNAMMSVPRNWMHLELFSYSILMDLHGPGPLRAGGCTVYGVN